VEYQLLTFGGLLVNVWGPTWDWIAHINYHRLLIYAVLISTGSTVQLLKEETKIKRRKEQDHSTDAKAFVTKATI
jgi:hypothetical protein